MRMLARTVLNVSLSTLVTIIHLIFTSGTVLQAAEFFCSSGNVTCLIAAINTANQNGQQNIINLEAGVYLLTVVDNIAPFGNANGLPVVSSVLTIQGAGAEVTTISRDENAPFFRILSVAAAGTLTLDGLTIQGGFADFINFEGVGGGGIKNEGTVTLIASTISENIALAGFGLAGGGIFNLGTMSIRESTIANNHAGLHSDGGGIVNLGSMTIRETTIVDNDTFNGSGGGIFNRGTMTISETTISGNLVIENSGGGIDNHGTLVITNSTIWGNRVGVGSGGGISNDGILSISGSTIAGNRVSGFAAAAGGISNIGTLIVSGSTIAGNSSINSGFPTNPRTSIGGIDNGVGAVVTLQNTILALNTSELGRSSDCSGPLISLGNNLVGDPTSCPVTLQPSDLTGDPGLGDFIVEDLPGRDYFPLLANSPAINSGNPGVCPATDQLGLPRVGICDIGSVEFQGRMLVSVDIRPKKDANRINPSSTKDINVAIFSINGFDATTVDSNTVRFGATGTEAAPVHVALRDVNADGHFDMVLRFQIKDTGIRCGDTSAILAAQTSIGLPIIGSSPIQTVQCKKQSVAFR